VSTWHVVSDKGETRIETHDGILVARASRDFARQIVDEHNSRDGLVVALTLIARAVGSNGCAEVARDALARVRP
jgi:hypothetical protein